MTTKPVRELLHSDGPNEWNEYEPLAEFRRPKKGEWYFGGYMDFPKQAEHNIDGEYWVLIPVKTEAKTSG